MERDMQTRIHSVIERVFDTAFAFLLSTLLMEYYINPAYGIDPNRSTQSAEIVAMFTILSFFRGLITRRIGNYFAVRHYRKKYGEKDEQSF